MSGSVEYLFAPSVTIADQAARKQGWLPRGRADWLKPDGTEVRFILLIEQLAAVGAGQTVHVIGKPKEPLRILERLGAAVVLHDAPPAWP
jgi:hypothetical protein